MPKYRSSLALQAVPFGKLSSRQIATLSYDLPSYERGTFVEQASAAQQASQDFPLLPTSRVDPTPAVEADADDNLTPAQRLAVAAIVSGETFASAARAAGVSRRTIYAWRQEEAFARAINELSREAVEAAVTRVHNLLLRATRVLSASLETSERGAMHAFRLLNSTRVWTIVDRAIGGDGKA